MIGNGTTVETPTRRGPLPLLPVPSATVRAYAGAVCLRHRKALGLTQETVGRHVGVTKSIISHFELGTDWVRIEVLLRLAYLFQIEVGAFFPPVAHDPALQELLSLFPLLEPTDQATLLYYARRLSGQDAPHAAEAD